MRVNVRLGRYGVENTQYWPGSTGITGVGMDIDGALEDALEQLWFGELADVPIDDTTADEIAARVWREIGVISPHEPTVEGWVLDNLGLDDDAEIDWNDVDTDLLYHVELLVDVLDD